MNFALQKALWGNVFIIGACLASSGRSLFQLYSMMSEALSDICPDQTVAFPIPYGCFCGLNSDDDIGVLRPVDTFDTICLEHDKCYRDSDCSGLEIYLANYEWSAHKNIECSWLQSRCMRVVCECDKALCDAMAAESVKSGCRTYQNDPKCPDDDKRKGFPAIIYQIYNIFN